MTDTLLYVLWFLALVLGVTGTALGLYAAVSALCRHDSFRGTLLERER